MGSSRFFLGKAEQCRRLAATIVMRHDPAVAALLALGAEFEALAAEWARRETDALLVRSRVSKPTGADAE